MENTLSWLRNTSFYNTREYGPCSLKLACVPYPEPDESWSHTPVLLDKNITNFILRWNSESPQILRFSEQNFPLQIVLVVSLWNFEEVKCEWMMAGSGEAQVCCEKSAWPRDIATRWSKPTAGLDRPLGIQEVEAPRISRQHKKAARLLTLPKGRLYPPGDIPSTHLC